MTTSVADVVEVLVALDGSAMAERALRPGMWLGFRLGVPVRLLEVVVDPSDAGLAELYLRGVGARSGADSWTVLIGLDPAAALTEAIGTSGRIIPVLGTRGRHRTERLAGSVTRRALTDIDAPVVLVGPNDDLPTATGPVVLLTKGCEPGTRQAAEWATALNAELVLVPERQVDDLTAALLEYHASLLLVTDTGDVEELTRLIHQAPCPVLVLRHECDGDIGPLPPERVGRTMTPFRTGGEDAVTEMSEKRSTPSGAHDAARREHQIAQEEAALAALERRAATASTTPWQRSAHQLAAEIHADAARSHQRAAALRDLEEAAEKHDA